MPTLTCKHCDTPECPFHGSDYVRCAKPQKDTYHGGPALDELVSYLRNLQREAAELEAEIEATKDLIKEHMCQQGVDTLLGPDYKVTWKEVTRTSLDVKAIRSAEPELCKQFERPATYRQFLLK